jgi:hypothetical protein
VAGTKPQAGSRRQAGGRDEQKSGHEHTPPLPGRWAISTTIHRGESSTSGVRGRLGRRENGMRRPEGRDRAAHFPEVSGGRPLSALD